MSHSYADRGDGISKRISPAWFGAAAILVLICLRWPLTLAVLGGVGIAFGLLWALNYTRHHTSWLILPLLLNEALASVNLIDDSVRPILRYSMLAIFCAPYVPTAFKTGLLKKGGFKLYAIYFIWAAITVCYSVYPLYSFGRVISAALLLTTVVAITASIKDEREIYDLIGIFWIGSVIIIAASALSLFVLPSDMTWKPDDNGMIRFAGLFNGPNQIGEVVLTTVASGIIYWPAASRRTRYVIAASIVLALTLDMMADSRSPFIALSVGVLLLTASKYGIKTLAPVALVAIAVMIVLPRLEGGRDYVMRGDVTSLTGRTDIWQYIIHAIKDRPILGYGYEVEGEIFQSRYFPLWEQIWNEGPRSSLHNGYLSRAVGVGIPATLLWAFIIGRGLKFALFDKRASVVLKNAALISSIPVLVLNMAESTAGDCRYSVGLLLAIVWALAERARLETVASDSTQHASGFDLAGRVMLMRQSVAPIQPHFEGL